jgi:hypothetical protein
MNGTPLFKFIIIVCLVFTGTALSARGYEGNNENAPGAGQVGFASIVVNGRSLTGPNSTASRRDGRILVPVVSIARALGDDVLVDISARSITVRRQTGVTADFDTRLGQVRENGSLVLAVSNASEIVFSPNRDDLMLPAEIVASLLDVAVRYDADKNIVVVTRGASETITPEGKSGQAPFELHQADYEYSLNHYSRFSGHNFALTAGGRLGDGRFNFSSNSTFASGRGFSLRNGTFTLERPNGQRFIAGDFGTGANLQFLNTYLRGGSASLPFGKTTVTAFAGRAYSGIFLPVADPLPQTQTQTPAEPRPNFGNRLYYDTNVYGVFAGTGQGTTLPPDPLNFSAGVMRFSGPNRSGDLIAGSVNYGVSRFRLQGDVGFGKFSGVRPDNSRFSGTGAAIDLSGTFHVTENFSLQGRYARIGENFLSPQSGLREPVSLKAAGLTWSPTKWLSTSFNASTSRRPGDPSQDNKFITAAFSITPSARMPRFYISHTQNSTSQIRSAAFTMLTASKEFTRLRLFFNATRIKTLGPATVNGQLGAAYLINDKHSVEFTQGAGSRGTLNGQFDWRTSNMLGGRLSFSAGGGYNHDKTSGFSTFERVSASLTLPRQTSLQLTYLQTNSGPTLLISLRGSLFRKRGTREFLSSAPAEMNSYGKMSGRVYQDVDLNGRFDPGTDKPQAGVKVRVDGSRLAESDENGFYRFDSVLAGEHKVYLDLLSVRADLTVLDGDAKNAALAAGRDSVNDFRLVRTGRISGRAWFDKNENGEFDEGEIPLADVRVVTASGRDTLTDSDGYFAIADLPPGDHVILLDEKTIPEKTVSAFKPLAIRVLPGKEAGDVKLPVILAPAEVKRFGLKAQ